MLEQSFQDLATASSIEARTAEILARSYLVAELEEDLLPKNKAEEIVDGHQRENNETWSRALHGALMGIRAAERNGLTLREDASHGPTTRPSSELR